MALKIIYQDNSLLVVDKPPGLVVTPSETQKEVTLAEILQKEHGINLERGGAVHRLDKDTSGVLLVAKTQQALENLQAQFKERKTKKEYLALVHGRIEQGGVIDAAIARNPFKREKFTASLQGVPLEALEARQAVTEYEPIGNYQLPITKLQTIFNDFNKIQFRKLSTIHYNLFTFLVVRPKTGRTHQIRVHLKYTGHPIVADEKYVGRKMVRLDHRWVHRQFLHAKKIGFYHPVSGEWMEVESPLPDDLKIALTYLKEESS